jgi:tetratricopeptide (TPR) repeat protein
VSALLLAVDLRGDGDPGASLGLAQRFQEALGDGRGGPLWREWTLARASMTIGAAHTDLSRPTEAEAELLRAVGRLEAVERDLRQRLAEIEAGIGPPTLATESDAVRRRGIDAQIELTRNYLADAFVSLAVNANVRANDPVRAVAFFERAFELRQGDFMVVLLACYRARVGRFDEARALLVGVHDAPPLYYNLACTHALLGDADRALDYLARSLEHSVRSPGARARQREWARDDPDLVSLRGDPRFDALTR